MSFKIWLKKSIDRYKTQSFQQATIRSAIEFYYGAISRTIDPFIGSVWWERDDWDILVIMDATRVDLARDTLDVPVESVLSPASTSIDWIERHFANHHREHWENAGYVTANPFADHDTGDVGSADLGNKNLGYFDPVYNEEWHKNPIGTTPPEQVTKRAIEAWHNEEIDRMIVHYMQPHQPFRSKPEWESVFSNMENLTTEVGKGGPDIWRRMRDGEIEREEMWDAYADNLWWVWCNIHNELLPNVSAKVLITADHGNGMGEWGSWSHHGGDLNPHVRKVPVMGPFSTGLDVIDENTVENAITKDVDKDVSIADQLSALGYR